MRLSDARRALAPALVVVGAVAALVMAAPAGANPGSSVTSSEPAAMEQAVEALDEGRYRRAAKHLKQHLRDNREDADALNLLGYSLRKLEKFEESEEYYLRALEIEPEHLGANEYLGELYLQTGRPELARERLTVLKKACPGSCEERRELEAALDGYDESDGP